MIRITSGSTTRCARTFRFAGTSTSNGNDRPFAPEVDQRVDVFGQGTDGGHLEHLVEENVTLQRAHEEQCRGARIADAQASGGGGAAKVIGDDGKTAAGRAVRLIER
jgi:hypothetical protein